MYASSKLKKVTQICEEKNFGLEEHYIRDKFMTCNFDTNKTIQKLINEENYKNYLFKWCTDNNYHPSKNIIIWCCKKNKFNPKKTLSTLKKIQKSRKELKLKINLEIKENLYKITDELIDNVILSNYGYIPVAYKQLKQVLLCH